MFFIGMLCTELIWLDSSGAVSSGHVAARTLNPAQVCAVAGVTSASPFLTPALSLRGLLRHFFVESGI